MKANQIFASTVRTLLFALGVACSESPTATPAAVATTLEAVSATNITGVVGSPVSERPTVIVRDQNGAPMAGVPVLFTLVAGGGSVSQGSVSTDAWGQASVSEWLLSMRPEKNVVAATTGLLRVEFHATSQAGPPVTLAKYAGDKQVAPRESAVPIRPQVRVSDTYNNALAGVTVVFAVAGGGGSLTDDNAITDVWGIATLGSWTLGAAGDQRLTATIASLAPVTFEARAVFVTSSCGVSVGLPQATTVHSELSARGCEAYTILSNADTYEFKLSTTSFDGRLELRDEAGNEIAVSDSLVSARSSGIRAVLPAGVFTLLVSSSDAGGAGRFDVSYAPSVTNRGGCDDAFIVRGVQFDRNVNSSCGPIWLLPGDRFRIRMSAGSRLTALLEDYSLSDNRFEMQNDQEQTLAFGVVKNYVDSNLDFTAPADGYYILRVQVAERYTLTVR